MSFFKRILSGIDDMKNSIEDKIYRSLSQKYPEIDQVLEVLRLMRRQYNQQCIAMGIADDVDGDGIIDDDEDRKWVPKIMTLGLLYKLQKNDCKRWYNHQDTFLHDTELEETLMNTFGFYWHMCVNISKCLRNSNPEVENDEELNNEDELTVTNDSETIIEHMTRVLGIEAEDIVVSHASDSNHLSEHCPDFALTVQHDHKLIVLTICGTRMIPAPEMKDIFMDLYADPEKFLHGYAHRGMVIGCDNILEKCLSDIEELVTGRCQGYGLMIVGYSLGAGISQLVTLELVEGEKASRIPEGTEIRCITFGTPPVFKSLDDGSYKCPNLFSVGYNNDGLISASIANVIKLFMEIRAIENLELRRRDIFKLLFFKKVCEAQEDDKEEDEPEDQAEDEEDIKEDDTGSEEGDVEDELQNSLWNNIREAVNKIEGVNDFIRLEHPSKLFLFKRKGDVITRIFQDTEPFSDSLRLRGSMFNDHMPWGYNALFQGYGTESSTVSIEALDISQ